MKSLTRVCTTTFNLKLKVIKCLEMCSQMFNSRVHFVAYQTVHSPHLAGVWYKSSNSSPVSLQFDAWNERPWDTRTPIRELGLEKSGSSALELYQMYLKYNKRPQNGLRVHRIYQHLPLQDPPKFTQIWIFGFKTNHLATLLIRSEWLQDMTKVLRSAFFSLFQHFSFLSYSGSCMFMTNWS
jgi:hypothetical protein